MEIDSYEYLDQVADQVLKSGLAATKSCLCFWTIEEAFSGKELIDYLAKATLPECKEKVDADADKLPPEEKATRLATRLFDGDLIRLTNNAKKPSDFKPKDMYTLTSIKNPFATFSMARIFELQQNPAATKDPMFICGKFTVARVFCVLLKNQLHMFRSRTSKVVRAILTLDGQCRYCMSKSNSRTLTKGPVRKMQTTTRKGSTQNSR